jgi:hypothetical protein
MNRGLALALLILAFALTLVGADVILLSDAVAENEAPLAVCAESTPASSEEVAAVRRAFEKNRFLFSVSVPLAYISEYEEALAQMEASILTRDESSFACARAAASQALSQIKRSALFSLGQIF